MASLREVGIVVAAFLVEYVVVFVVSKNFVEFEVAFNTDDLAASVCVCEFILFHLLVSSGCTTSLTYVRSSDQRSFVVSISVTALCQVPSSPYLKMSYFNSKDENSSPTLLERKRYDIMCANKNYIY